MRQSRLELFFTKRTVIALAILWVLANMVFQFGPWSLSALQEVSGTKTIPDMMGSYDRLELVKLFTVYGSEGIAIYKNLQIVDFVYPLIYAALLLGLLVRIKLPANAKFLYANPFAIVFFDYSENLIIRHLINAFPNLDPSFNTLANLASLLTLLKWTFISTTLFTILVFWIWGLVKRRS